MVDEATEAFEQKKKTSMQRLKQVLMKALER